MQGLSGLKPHSTSNRIYKERFADKNSSRERKQEKANEAGGGG